MICDGCKNHPICRFFKALKIIAEESKNVLVIEGTCSCKISAENTEEKKCDASIDEMMNKVFNFGSNTSNEQITAIDPYEFMVCEECGKEVPEYDITEDLKTRKSLCPDCYEKASAALI